MKHFWKKTLWAALLTATFALSATGCGNDSQTSSSTANSADSAAQTEESSAAPAENGGAADAADTNVFTYEMRDDGTVTITGYQGAETALDIPSTVDNYVVSAIADHAFEANWDITSVTLPSGLSEIGEGAFMDCGNLTSVTIPDTVAQIDRAAFAGCSSLASLSLPETVSTVMEEAFTGCAGLTDLTVANASLEYDSWGLVEGSEPLNVTITCPAGSAIETWAAANGIVTGTDSTSFSPDAKVTREQLAAILYRYAQYRKLDTDASAKLNSFTDADSVSAYASEALGWAVSEGLINGASGKLMPKGDATRAQVAAILHRFVKNVLN